MHLNFVAVLIAALIPMVVGFIWYNPKVFGTAWMNATGMTPEKGKQSNMAIVFGVSLVVSFIMAFGLQFMTIHQFHVTSLFYKLPINDATTTEGALYKQVMDLLGGSWRTFSHGAIHGLIGSIMIVMPVVVTNSLFEQKGFKYMALTVGYWMVCMTIMGGIICSMP